MKNITQIIKRLEGQREIVERQLTRLNEAIRALRGSVPTNRAKPRRALSAAARKRIAAAQKARWAAWKSKQKKSAA